MAFSKNYNKLFIDPDNNSAYWSDKFFELARLEAFEKLDEHVKSADKLYMYEYQIYSILSDYTLNDFSDSEKMEKLNYLKTLDEYVKDLNFKNGKITIETTKGTIIAMKLTDPFPALKDSFPEIETKEREGNCHRGSVDLSPLISENNSLVTGYIYGLSSKVKLLHSWIELDIGKNPYVIDYTMNIIMNKEGFYQMNHANPLCKISKEDLKKDKDMILKLSELGNLDLKEYLVFRDEIKKDFKKNKDLFNKFDEER